MHSKEKMKFKKIDNTTYWPGYEWLEFCIEYNLARCTERKGQRYPAVGS